jgi:hypothetical protein
MEFWEAIKVYTQEKRMIQFESLHDGTWINFDEALCQCPNKYLNRNWRLKPEPVKYSVDIWLDREPVHEDRDFLFKQTILGQNTCYLFQQSERCNKKYKITIQSVEE